MCFGLCHISGCTVDWPRLVAHDFLLKHLLTVLMHVLRLSELETSHAVLSNEVSSMREIGFQLEMWKDKVEEASEQLGGVLALVESDSAQFR